MVDLFTYLRNLSKNSDFKAELSTRGGFVTFSNSGRRGGVKYFQLGLDNIIQTLKDIYAHLDIFKQIAEYDETPWRNNGSNYFEDAVANANSTVQTKPLFSTLSKVIIWANQPNLDNVDPDKHIDLSESNLITTIDKLEELANSFKPKVIQSKNKLYRVSRVYRLCLTAIKSKPFLLLAGISGTGKSRIVREFAFKSCPKYLQDRDGTTPGNYCMIEVKPNWHDSTELLGYYSNLNKKYQFTKFVKFLVKAKMFPEVPFFVCLDEMNLAPVEQYFAEILSILETRKHPKNAETGEVDMCIIKTETLIESSFFKELKWIDDNNTAHVKTDMTDMNWYTEFFEVEKESEEEKLIKKYQYSRSLQEEGLKLPHNVIIIGTVNMDETTHQFSRKVIDRAMTIEMNGGNLRSMFGGSQDLEYLKDEEQEKWQDAFTRRYITADEVLEAYPEVADKLMDELPSRLEAINSVLKGTPFEVSYRVLNEFTIMVGVMLDENRDMELDDIINQALNNILLMKILPRIEGDAEMFALSRDYKEKMGIKYNNRLEWLKELAPNIQEVSTKETPEDEDDAKSPDESKEHQQTAKEKIQEMIDRLNNLEYTRFWP